MSAVQDRIDAAFMRRHIELIRVGNATSREDAADLRSLAYEIRGILAQRELSGMAARPLRQLLRELEDLIDQYAAMMRRRALSNIDALPEDETDWLAALLSLPNMPREFPSIASVVVMGHTVDELWSHFARWAKQRVQAAVRDSSITGSDVMAVLFGLGAPRTPSGILGRGRDQLAAMNDSITQGVAAYARQTVYMMNGINVLRWQSVLDGHTTEGCAIRHGLLYDRNYRPINHSIVLDRPPPRHFKCRSMFIPETRDPLDIPADGETAPQAFSRWLNSMTGDERVDLFGAGKYELWASGQITKRDLVGQDGRVLTLAQLRARYGLAAQG